MAADATAQQGEDPHAAARPAISLKEQREALREGKVIGFTCSACHYDRFSPMSRCPKCKSTAIATRPFSKTGKVESYTIQAVASEQFLNETPFAFAVIQLDDGPRVSGWIPWIAKPKDLAVGQKVEYTPSYKPGMLFEKR
ncbi:MAG: OB-fold domain-containing protein [bacterium]